MNFDTCRKQSPEAFIRLTGVSKVIFQRLLKDLETAFKKDKDAKPITKRGLKAAFSIEDQLLLTLLYMRQYSTFFMLGVEFGISESYANKVYHKISNKLLDVMDLPDEEALTSAFHNRVAVDVSEQEIERPTKRQRKAFSGKKKTHA